MIKITGRATCVTNTAITLRVQSLGTTVSPAVCTIASTGAGAFVPSSFTIPTGTDEYIDVVFTPSATGSHIVTVDSDTLPDARFQFGVNTAGQFADVEIARDTVYFSPGNWDILEPDDYTGVTTRCAQTGNSGAYLKFRVEDTSECWMRINPNIYGLAPAETRPYIRVSVDGRPFSIVQITGQDYQLFGGTAPADILVEFRLDQYIPSDGNGSYPRWSSDPALSLVNGVRLLSLFVPAGGNVTTSQEVKPNTMMVCGDSITDGTGAGTGSPANDALYAYHQIMGTGLNAEVGTIGFGGMGWLGQGTYLDSDFRGTWATYSAGRPRDFTGLDYLMVNMGTNDQILGSVPSATLEATVLTWLGNARAIIPATTKIVLLVPPADYYKTAFEGAVADHRAATGDSLVYVSANSDYMDTAAIATASTGAWWSADAYHPSSLGHAHLAIAYTKSLFDKIGIYGSEANYETCAGGYA